MNSDRRRFPRGSNDYDEWIKEWAAGNCYIRCQEYTWAMCKHFPELRRVEGVWIDATGERHGHFWCETPDGEIVDPTFEQFECLDGLGSRYEEETWASNKWISKPEHSLDDFYWRLRAEVERARGPEIEARDRPVRKAAVSSLRDHRQAASREDTGSR